MKYLLIICLTLLMAKEAYAQTWKSAKDENGIKVYLADAEGTKVKQFKVEAFVDAQPKAIAEAILDLENSYKWLQNVEKAQLVSRTSPTSFIYKQVVKVPYPFDDRMVVQQCTVSYLAGGIIRIDLVEKNDAVPLDDDYVRMPIVRGYWLLKPKNTGTEVEYCFLGDPGGSIPIWLTNQFIVDGPYKSIAALRNFMAD